MIAELGSLSLICALLLAMLQACALIPVPAVQRWSTPLLRHGMWLQTLLVTLALTWLIMLRVDNDFSVVNVAQHSNQTLPLLYKITGAWGNHEGSMLLWVWVLSAYGLALSTKPNPFKQKALAVQALLAVATLLFILTTSSPFERQFPAPLDGAALNPLLQDIALSIHPPLLYLGYVGFSLVFSLSVAGLLQGRIDREWARLAHPWIMAAWGSLTIGIGLGSWWAYRELGWGGWWFWDPVENASLIPWLCGTALLHANIVLKKRGMLASWVALLSIFTFGLSLIGTFLVRSGALTSVHSFASDPARGLFILGYVVLAVGGSLLLFSMRSPSLEETAPMRPASREGMMIINNLFLLTACATVLLGTTYPLLVEWMSNEKLTVGAPFFNLTFLPMMAVPLVFAGITPFMPWKKASWRESLRKTRPAMLATTVAILMVLAVAEREVTLACVGFGLSAWLGVSSLSWMIGQQRNAMTWAVTLGHLGAAVMVAGITGNSLFKESTERWLEPGGVVSLSGYEFQLGDLTLESHPNYQAKIGHFIVRDANRLVAELTPEYRTYPIRNMPTSEADIHHGLTQDLYTVIGEASPDGRQTAIRVYVEPLISLIWLGFVLMALAALLTITQRKHYGSPNI